MGTDELLEACDRALLRSKRQGKGRVTQGAGAGASRRLAARAARARPAGRVCETGGRPR